jgi:hypothetical protein
VVANCSVLVVEVQKHHYWVHCKVQSQHIVRGLWGYRKTNNLETFCMAYSLIVHMPPTYRLKSQHTFRVLVVPENARFNSYRPLRVFGSGDGTV